MDLQDLLLVALRASLVYFYVLVVIRILGKRTVQATAAFDLLVALMLGEVVDEVIYGDVTMAKGLLAITVIAGWHFANSWASYRSKRIEHLTGSRPDILVRSGQFVEEALAKERLNRDEVLSELRLLEINDLKEVREAVLEPNGRISVLREDWAEPLRKGDIDGSAPEQPGEPIAVSVQQGIKQE